MSKGETSAIFDSLPGVAVPVGQVAQSLDEIWAGAPNGGAAAPSEFRASQMNLVLHLGMRATPASAQEQFSNALALSRRYPARTVILCPMQPDEGGSSMCAKIFSECYIGKSGKEMVCCEVVLLSYPFDTRCYLENQVSVCLEADLPLYYWPHCIASAARLEDYSYLMNGARRIIVDSACENPHVAEALAQFAPKLRDLADSRLQQVRQSLGRFLSGFPPESLIDGLLNVTVSHNSSLAAEGRRLLAWMRESLALCGGPGLPDSAFLTLTDSADRPADLALEMIFSDATRSLRWEADFGAGNAQMSANVGSGVISTRGPVALLKPEVSLAESIFS